VARPFNCPQKLRSIRRSKERPYRPQAIMHWVSGHRKEAFEVRAFVRNTSLLAMRACSEHHGESGQRRQKDLHAEIIVQAFFREAFYADREMGYFEGRLCLRS
jgi:hypothetical protein